MLYTPPTGGAANDPYVGKNTAAGIQGSKVPPGAIEFGQREIVAAISASGQTPSNSDLTQLAKAIPLLAGGKLHIGDDTSSTASLITVDVSPSITVYAADHVYLVSVAHACPGATNANLDGVGNRPVKRCDGSVPEATDWAAGDRLLLADDGTNLRLVGLTKLQAQELAVSTTTINSTTQTYIDKSTPRGSTKLSAFSAGVVATDIAITGSGTPFTTTQQTGNITGASYVDASGTCALKDNAGTGSEGSGTMRLRLTDVTAGTTYDSNYVGGGAFNQSVQVSLVIPRFIFVLNPAHTYNVSQICQKGSGVGPTIILDTYIFAQHDGSNL